MLLNTFKAKKIAGKIKNTQKKESRNKREKETADMLCLGKAS